MERLQAQDPTVCQFCMNGPEIENIAGQLHAEVADSGKTVSAHHKCMQYASALTQYKSGVFGGFNINEVEKEISRGNRLRCALCKTRKKKKSRGASSGCAIQSCRKTFHYPCAFEDPDTITKRFVVTTNKNNDAMEKYVYYRVFCCKDHEVVFRRTLTEQLRRGISRRKRKSGNDASCFSGHESETELANDPSKAKPMFSVKNENVTPTKLLPRLASLDNMNQNDMTRSTENSKKPSSGSSSSSFMSKKTHPASKIRSDVFKDNYLVMHSNKQSVQMDVDMIAKPSQYHLDSNAESPLKECFVNLEDSQINPVTPPRNASLRTTQHSPNSSFIPEQSDNPCDAPLLSSPRMPSHLTMQADTRYAQHSSVSNQPNKQNQRKRYLPQGTFDETSSSASSSSENFIDLQSLCPRLRNSNKKREDESIDVLNTGQSADRPENDEVNLIHSPFAASSDGEIDSGERKVKYARRVAIASKRSKRKNANNKRASQGLRRGSFSRKRTNSNVHNGAGVHSNQESETDKGHLGNDPSETKLISENATLTRLSPKVNQNDLTRSTGISKNPSSFSGSSFPKSKKIKSASKPRVNGLEVDDLVMYTKNQPVKMDSDMVSKPQQSHLDSNAKYPLKECFVNLEGSEINITSQNSLTHNLKETSQIIPVTPLRSTSCRTLTKQHSPNSFIPEQSDNPCDDPLLSSPRMLSHLTMQADTRYAQHSSVSNQPNKQNQRKRYLPQGTFDETSSSASSSSENFIDVQSLCPRLRNSNKKSENKSTDVLSNYQSADRPKYDEINLVHSPFARVSVACERSKRKNDSNDRATVLLIPCDMKEFEQHESLVTEMACHLFKVKKESLCIWQRITKQSLSPKLLLFFMLDLVKELASGNSAEFLKLLFDEQLLNARHGKFEAQAKIFQNLGDEISQTSVQTAIVTGLEKNVNTIPMAHLLHLEDQNVPTLAIDVHHHKDSQLVQAYLQTYKGLYRWQRDTKATAFNIPTADKQWAMQVEALTWQVWLTKFHPASEVIVLPADGYLVDNSAADSVEFSSLVEFLKRATEKNTTDSSLQSCEPLLVFQKIDLHVLRFPEYFRKTCHMIFRTRKLETITVLLPLSNIVGSSYESINGLLNDETSDVYPMTISSVFCPEDHSTSVVLLKISFSVSTSSPVHSDSAQLETQTIPQMRRRGRPRKNRCESVIHNDSSSSTK